MEWQQRGDGSQWRSCLALSIARWPGSCTCCPVLPDPQAFQGRHGRAYLFSDV